VKVTGWRRGTFVVLILVAVTFYLVLPWVEPVTSPIVQRVTGKKTTTDRIDEFGEASRARMRAAFGTATVPYPPNAVTLVAIKSERKLYVFAGGTEDEQVLVKTYAVLGQSGILGPKLREGDLQVPEGIYAIEGLNPNSAFYVSLRLNYPNSQDLERAELDGRSNPGSDIYIHGHDASVGCLAMGDTAIEELFTLVADVGKENIRVIITPIDFRGSSEEYECPTQPSWLPGLYEEIETALRSL
jgi:hypothetical protein